MYMPLRNACARMAPLDAGGRSLYSVSMRNELAPGTDQLCAVWAISAETAVTAWTYEQRAATMSLAVTAGGVVFVGDVNGRFRALDDETGEVLWEVNLGSPVSGFPVTPTGRRPAIRRGGHGPRRQRLPLERDDPGATSEQRQQHLRVRSAVGLQRLVSRGRRRKLGLGAAALVSLAEA